MQQNNQSIFKLKLEKILQIPRTRPLPRGLQIHLRKDPLLKRVEGCETGKAKALRWRIAKKNCGTEVRTPPKTTVEQNYASPCSQVLVMLMCYHCVAVGLAASII